ncbi:terminase [Mycobacterium phage LittleE]|uniref:Terminase n=1 Tax=Mycobacterium phage LittleE TaxID=2922212 RepID=G1D3N6_9CAUD|nr:terminase large subunit [Mycobacterium phage LittleE]AEK09386.1 terminase [Mycobacterium phage LittleE]
MELLAHQKLIHETIDKSSISAFAAPRQNGKTYAALAYALQYPGRVLYFGRGFREAGEAFAAATKLGANRGPGTWHILKTNKSQLSIETSLCGDFGRVNFMPYGRGSGRGMEADLVILDDAHEVEADVLAEISPCVLRTGGKIAGFGTIREKLLKHLLNIADGHLRWRSSHDIEEANPALGYLFTMEQVEREKKLLPERIFARERMGYDPSRFTTISARTS